MATTSPPELVRRREALRDFLRSRRARLSPEDVGLPGGGRRRTPGLRREEVAVLAGVGASWYMWLEQGRDIRVSESVMDAIAVALRMSELERVHFYRLAGMNPPQPVTSDEAEVSAELRRVLDTWLPNPAYVLDRYWNVRAVNDAARVVLGLRDGDTMNCLVAYFTEPAFRNRYRYWADYAPHVVSEFRVDAARYPDDPVFGPLTQQLCEESPEFAELWAKHDVQDHSGGVKAIEHPRAGCLIFEHTTLRLADRADLRLVLQTPQAHTDTMTKLKALLEHEARRVALVEAG
ncbi:helix-turn-helix transcriptional regulator [Actinokineospora diospyrosa]|uniref:Helix-turn-helix domain-containing protein n=1 Tax=Actinokineospora diospyrosa TaxID=103728 RepID=A0ABT1IIX0_9PSEU|nr:helix-turn-helix transcriptional regulator [Actinokineospora diospyrosa]MCP2272604.1 Helix-turn-helix domain-containing protein [Actinokineospora diospyrosa]